MVKNKITGHFHQLVYLQTDRDNCVDEKKNSGESLRRSRFYCHWSIFPQPTQIVAKLRTLNCNYEVEPRLTASRTRLDLFTNLWNKGQIAEMTVVDIWDFFG